MPSDFPTDLDPSVPTLRDDVDGFRANGLQHIADMVIAVQTILGVDLGNLTSDPGYGNSSKMGNLSQAMQSLFRMDTGLIDFTYNPSSMAEATAEPAAEINLAFNRFRTPPFVMIQTIEAHQATGSAGMGAGSPSLAGLRESRIFPVNITKTRFGIALSQRCVGMAEAAGAGIPIKGYWLAIEPPFGIAEYQTTNTG